MRRVNIEAILCLGTLLGCSAPERQGRVADSEVSSVAGASGDATDGGSKLGDLGKSNPMSLAPRRPAEAASSRAPNDPSSSGSSERDQPAKVCAGIDEMAKIVPPPADIIIAIDSTSSMTEETMFVQTQINALSQRIIDSNVDVRVILICEKPGTLVQNPICVPPPLAAANCGDNEPLFKHIDQAIGNHDAWEQIIATYPQYKHLLRQGAPKHLVVITDDEPDLARASFDQMLKALDPQFEGYRHHAIYAFTFPGEARACAGSGDPCCGFGDGDGAEYGRLCEDTHGVRGNICLQDFEPVWSELVTNVTQSANLACDWEIPAPPTGETLDPMQVNVHYSGEGRAPQLIGWVPGASGCGANDGWYYDDESAPSRVFACPQTCSMIRGLANARIDIKFGCKRCGGLDADCGGDPPPVPPRPD